MLVLVQRRGDRAAAQRRWRDLAPWFVKRPLGLDVGEMARAPVPEDGRRHHHDVGADVGLHHVAAPADTDEAASDASARDLGRQVARSTADDSEACRACS